MCSNYTPVTRADRLLSFFGALRNRDDPPLDIWPLGLAPIIRLHEDGSGNRVCDDGVFGLLPFFATELAYGRKTYNARAETVDRLASFKHAWAAGQRCIVPAESVFALNYESGSAVRWCIQKPGASPMGLAGLYRKWQHPDGREMLTFSIITVNADGHPIFERMHKPGDEKRMPAIIDPKDYGAYLARPVDEARALLKPWHGPLETFAAPLPPRAPRSAGIRSAPPSNDEPQGDLV